MTQVIGDPSSAGRGRGTCELRFFGDSHLVATVHQDMVEKVEIGSRVGSLWYLELRLAGPLGAGLAKVDCADSVEVWLSRDTQPLTLVSIIKIDWSSAGHDAEHEFYECQGRSPCAALVDNRCELSHSGYLDDLLKMICDSQQLVCEVDDNLSERNVDFYASAPSAYGVVRLIGGASALIATPTNDGLRVESLGDYSEKLKRSVPARIGPDDILSAKREIGTRVRRRE